MLEVHAPHETIHTWKDFFIHVATICVGLLIAVGLEQGVVWIEHQHEVHETREKLKAERERNIDHFHTTVSEMRVTDAGLENDLRIFLYLQKHPGTPPDKLPGVFTTILDHWSPETSAWDAAQRSNILQLMPNDEVESTRFLYTMLKVADDKVVDVQLDLEKAGAFRITQPDLSKLTPAQVTAEIEMLRNCLREMYEYAWSLWVVAEGHPDFSPGPTDEELQSMRHADSIDIESKKYPEAYAYTRRDLTAAEQVNSAQALEIDFYKELEQPGSKDVESIYNNIVKTNPNFKPSQDSLINRGYLLMTNLKLSEATALFKLTVRLYPLSWNAYDSLGESYMKAGNKDLAIANYETSLKLNPDNTNAIDMLQKLKR